MKSFFLYRSSLHVGLISRRRYPYLTSRTNCERHGVSIQLLYHTNLLGVGKNSLGGVKLSIVDGLNNSI